MAELAHARSRHRTTSRKGIADWISAPIVGVLASSWPVRLAFGGGFAATMLVVVAVAGHVFSGWQLWGAARLPASAAERAPLFTEAWIAHDAASMKRFVRAADAAKLAAWIAATPVPDAVAGMSPAERKIKTVSVERDDSDGAIVEVRISPHRSADGQAAGSGVVERQTWTCSGGNWFFSVAPPPAATMAGVASSGAMAASRLVIKPNVVPRQSSPRPADDLDCH